MLGESLSLPAAIFFLLDVSTGLKGREEGVATATMKRAVRIITAALSCDKIPRIARTCNTLVLS